MDQQQPTHGLRTLAIVVFTLVLIGGVALAGYWWGIKSVSQPGQTQTAAPKAETKSETKNIATKNEMLSVTAPTPNQAVTTPVRVAGSSNFFEAHTSIRIKDANGNVLAQSFAIAAGWMDKLYPFATNVSYSRPATATGTVEVFEASAKDGNDQNLISIPVKFVEK